MNKGREVPIRYIIRRRGHGGGHHGGAWKVAFADFMTAMFALFLVLWLVNQSSDVKSAIAGYFQDPLGRASEYGSSILPGEGAQSAAVRPLRPPDVVEMRRDRMMAVAERLREKLDRMPDLQSVKDQIEITVTDEGLQIQLLEDATGVFFETGRAVPSPRGEEVLGFLGNELKSLPNHLLIEGYTDARPYPGGSHYTNWELSTDRANTARRILTGHGVPTGHVREIRGHAERNLRDPADPFSPKNRRVTITVAFEPSLQASAEAADSTAAPEESAVEGAESESAPPAEAPPDTLRDPAAGMTAP